MKTARRRVSPQAGVRLSPPTVLYRMSKTERVLDELSLNAERTGTRTAARNAGTSSVS